LSCHEPQVRGKSHTDFQVALAGNPNVGKSALFNRLTGLTAITANYPGKTVELNVGIVRHRGSKFTLLDLPGTYGLDAVSEDQSVAKEALLFERYAAVIVVVDSSNLERNLYQVLQLIDLGLPIIVALNMVDHAARKGIAVDISKLAHLLGVPVLPIVAITGQGVRKLLDAIIAVAKGQSRSTERSVGFAYTYSDLVAKFRESARDLNMAFPPRTLPPGFQSRLIEGDTEIEATLKGTPDGRKIIELANALRTAIEIKENEPAQLVFTQERQRIAQEITEETIRPIKMREEAALLGRHYAVWPPTAIPLMFGVIIGVFAFMFFVGGFLSDLIGELWGSFISPVLRLMAYWVLGNGIAARILLWGVDGGILAALSVGVPYVLTFYFVLAILEDTGYLGNVAYITDNVMRKLGLQGRSIIPLIMGLGCNVPAIMATRVLTTRRERVLASTLITLTPCSARIAVVLGAVAYIVGWQYAVAVFLIDLTVIGAIGKALSLVLPGESSGLVMEMFPFHMPSLRSILSKTWFRFKAFVFVAFPVVILGSIFLGGLFEFGFLNTLTEISGPTLYAVVGLPPVAAIALFLGILRKELTLQLLVALAVMQYGASARNLAVFMSPTQLFVFALVVTLYFPCVATMSLLGKEMGWKSTVAIMTGDIGIAMIIGAVFFHLLMAVRLV
jgi:ferrous iron transport protein B